MNLDLVKVDLPNRRHPASAVQSPRVKISMKFNFVPKFVNASV